MIEVFTTIIFVLVAALGYFVQTKFKELKDLRTRVDDHQTRLTVLEEIMTKSLEHIRVTVDESSKQMYVMQQDIVEIKSDVRHLTEKHNDQKQELDNIKNQNNK